MELPAGLVERLKDVRTAGAITGAGISVESGIQPYRGEGGIYDDPDEGERTVEALTGSTLVRDPDRTWRAVSKLARQARDARPNPAQHALAEMERNLDRFVLLTQNVDGLHHMAGSRNVICIHGNVLDTRCMGCGAEGRLDPEGLMALDAAPRCSACEGVLRPGAVLFGEMLPAREVARMQEEFHLRTPDLVMLIGTTALFPYIAEPVVHAWRQGKLTVEVNPERTYLSGEVDFFLQGPAGEYLPLIAAATSRG